MHGLLGWVRQGIHRRVGKGISTYYLIMGLCISGVVMSWGNAGWIYAKAVLAQYLITQTWAAQQAGDTHAKPWPWADTWPVATLQYGNQQWFVLNGGDGSTLAFGPGLLPQSKPFNEGTVLIAGHRDTHFAFLKNVIQGDTLQLQNRQGRDFRYRIVSTQVIDSSQTDLQINTETNQLILLTCYPFDAVNPNGPLRYVVTAIPVT